MGTQRQSPRGDYDELYRYSGLGLQFSATLVIFGLGGRWLDGRLGTEPWLLIVMVFAGFGLGVLSMIKKLPSSKPPRSGSGSDSPSETPTSSSKTPQAKTPPE